MREVKNRIRDLREDMDLRQCDVAKGTGMDQKTLSNYETGRTNPDSDALIKLANFFGVTTDYLLGISDFNIRNKEDLQKMLKNMEKQLKEIQHVLS